MTAPSDQQKLSEDKKKAVTLGMMGVVIAALGAAMIWGPGGLFMVFGTAMFVVSILAMSEAQ